MKGLSNSEVANFRQCMRKWYWENMQSLTSINPRSDTSALEIGNRFHAWREADSAGNASPPSPLLDPKAVAIDIWLREDYLEWLESTGADADWRVLSVEASYSLDWGGVSRPLIGKVDEIREHPRHGKVILDYKTTGKPLASHATTLASGTQVLHYAALTGLRTFILRMVKVGGLAGDRHLDHVVYISDEQVSHYLESLSFWEKRMEEIAALPSPPPGSPSESCSWCPFKIPCQTLDMGGDWQYIIDTEFITHDDLARYTTKETS